MKPLERLPCEPECVQPTAPHIVARIEPMRQHLADSWAAITLPIYQRTEALARRLDSLHQSVRARLQARIAELTGSLRAWHTMIGDRFLGRIGAIVGRNADLLDLSRMEREAIARAGQLPAPDAPLPPPPQPRGEWRMRATPSVQPTLYPFDAHGTPAIVGVPDWIADIEGRFGITPTGAQQPPAGGVSSTDGVRNSVPRTDAGTPAPAAALQGGVQPPGDPQAPGGTPLAAYAAASGAAPSVAFVASTLGAPPDTAAALGAAAPLVQLIREEVRRGIADLAGYPGATDERDVSGGVSGSGAGAGAETVVRGAGCGDVHVHLACPEGAPPAPDAGADSVFLIGADTPVSEMSFDERTQRSQEQWAQWLGASSSKNPLPALLGFLTTPVDEAGEPVPDVADQFVDWLSRFQEMFRTVVPVARCSEATSAAKDLNAIVESVWQWLSGTKDGRGWDREKGLPKQLSALPLGLNVLAEVIVGLLVWLVRFQANTYSTLAGCDNPAMLPVSLVRGLLGVIEGWGQIPLPEMRGKVDQLAGSICPVGIPTIGDANTMYLANLIDQQQWACLVRANGGRDEWFQHLRHALRTVPSPLQIANIAMRLDASPGRTKSMLREAGVLDDKHVRWFMKLAEYVPSPSDLISFMLRDVFDPAVVAKYGYDEQFGEKYQGRIVPWARSQGMSEEMFRSYWHAHWRLPSPTQGFEFLHRLRPGRVAPDLVTTHDDVVQLLNVNDYPTYWAKRLAAVSYKPLTRVDTRRAYFLGALTEDETREAILDLGYDAARADLLLRYWRFERVEWLLRRPFAKAFVEGALSDEELDQELLRLRLSELQVQQLRAALGARAAAAHRLRVVGNIRRRVVSGMSSPADAAAELVRSGYAQARAEKMAAQWEEERDSKGRVITAAQLCKMYSTGIIGGETYTAGMLRLGYSLLDARRMIALCEADKKLEPSAFGVEGEDAERVAAARERSEKILAARRENIAKARAARKERGQSGEEERALKRLATVASYLAKGLGGYAPDYQPQLGRMYKQLVDGACYSLTGAADLIYAVVVPMAKARNPDWETLAADYFRQLPPRPCGQLPPARELLPLPESQQDDKADGP